MANNFPGYVINNTTIAVDHWPRANNSHITHYFLTHAHTDHTKGLDETWNGPALYCSNITKKLIISLLNVPEEYIIDLEMNQPHIMRLNANDTFNVTLINANHCPGAVMYLFEGYFGTILSTGDFRYAANMFEDTVLENKQVDICYLDNTYLNSTYTNIPLRNEATEELIQLIKVKIKNNSNILFAIIMKNLGKEDMLIQIAKTFDTKILISTKRFERYINALSLDESYFTTVYNSDIFICADDSDLNIAHNIKDRKLIRIKPSALDYACEKRPKKLQVVIDLYSKSISTYYNVPYTDHSSFSELIDFVKFLKPKRLIPIVPQLKEKKINNTDISHLKKYLNDEPLIDSTDKFKQILESTSSIRLNPTFRMPLNEHKKTSPLIETKRKLRPRTSELFLYRSRYHKIKPIKHKTEIEYESSPEKNSTQNVKELRVLRSNRRLSEAIPLMSEIPTRIDENDKENSPIFDAKIEQEKLDESEDDLDINESIHLDHLKANNTICSTNIYSTKSSEQILITEDVIQDESFINMLKAASKRGSVSDKQSIGQEENQIQISIVKNNSNQSELSPLESSLTIKHTQKSDDEEADQNDISRLDLSLTFTENDPLTDNIQLSDNENETRSEKINTESAIIITTDKPNRNPTETTSNDFYSTLSARLNGLGVNTKQENLKDKMLKFLMNSFES